MHIPNVKCSFELFVLHLSMNLANENCVYLYHLLSLRMTARFLTIYSTLMLLVPLNLIGYEIRCVSG